MQEFDLIGSYDHFWIVLICILKEMGVLGGQKLYLNWVGYVEMNYILFQY